MWAKLRDYAICRANPFLIILMFLSTVCISISICIVSIIYSLRNMHNENLKYKMKFFLLDYFGHRINRIDYRLYIYIPKYVFLNTCSGCDGCLCVRIFTGSHSFHYVWGGVYVWVGGFQWFFQAAPRHFLTRFNLNAGNLLASSSPW